MQYLVQGILLLLFISASNAWGQKLVHFEYLIPNQENTAVFGISKESSIIAISGNLNGNYILTERSGCYFLPYGKRPELEIQRLPTDRRRDLFQQLITKGDTTYIWANGHELLELSGQKEKRTPIIGEHFAKNLNPTCVTMDQQGRLFIGTAADGLFIFQPQANGIYTPKRVSTVGQQLPSNKVNCLYKDESGTIWIGTDNGVSTFHNDSIYNLSPPPSNKSRSMWDHLFGSMTESNESLNVPVHAISKWGSSMILASPEHLIRISANPDTITQVFHFSVNDRLSSPLTVVNKLHTDLSGNIWILGDQLVRFNITTNKLSQMNTLYKFRGRSFTSIYEDLNRNCIWIGTHRGGLYRYDLR